MIGFFAHGETIIKRYVKEFQKKFDEMGEGENGAEDAAQQKFLDGLQELERHSSQND